LTERAWVIVESLVPAAKPGGRRCPRRARCGERDGAVAGVRDAAWRFLL